MLSIILCATTLMPARSVVWAAGDDDKNDSKTPTSVNESKTSLEEGHSVQTNKENLIDKSNDKKAIQNDGKVSDIGDKNTIIVKPIFCDKEIKIKKSQKRISKNRLKRARDRQESRKKGLEENREVSFRYLSQLYTACIDPNYVEKNKNTISLRTLFGLVSCKFEKQKNGFNIKVENDKIDTKYENLCKKIETVLNKEGQRELAKEILDYLETPVDQEIKTCHLFNAKSKYWDNKYSKYFNDNIKGQYDIIYEAEKCAAALSGILFIAEPAENRMFDGGKSARGVLRAIRNGCKTFNEAFVNFENNEPWYPIAKAPSINKKGKKICHGAKRARYLSKGEHVGFIENFKYVNRYSSEIEQYFSDSSDEE